MISALAMIIAALYALKGRNSISAEQNNDLHAELYIIKHEKIVWLIVMTIATILRTWQMGHVPDAVNQDTAMAALNAKSLLMYRTDLDGIFMPVHLNGWGYAQMNAMSSYLMIPFIKLFGMNRVSIGIPILLMSMLGMAAGYFLVREMFGVFCAFIFNVICMFNPWHFVQSRWSLEANFFPHFFVIAVLFLFLGVKYARRRYLYFSMIVFGLSHYNYGVSLYIVFSFLFLVCVFLIRKKLIPGAQAIISGILYSLTSWLFYAMILINTFHLATIKTPFFTIPYFPESQRSGDILFFSEHPIKQLFENIYSFISVIFLQKDEILWSNVPRMGTLMLCMVPVMILGFIILINRAKQDKENALTYDIIFIWLIASFIDGIITKDVNSNRLNVIFYCCLILITIGMDAIIRCGKTVRLISAGMFLIMSIFFITDYYTVYAARFFDPEYSFSGNLDLALEKAKSIEAERYVITPDTQYIGAKDVSEIDTMFFWDMDARYYRGETNEMNGKKYLPYSERFQYYKINAGNRIDSKESTVYIVNSGDQKLFDPEQFAYYDYVQFYVVAPRWLEQ